jgi:hypothetical protein
LLLNIASPLAISEPTAVGQTLGLLCPRTSSRLAVAKTNSSDRPIRAYPSWIYGAWRFRRYRHCCRSGLASGVSSLCRLGRTVARFLRVRRPWLSWAFSSLGHSPSQPEPQQLLYQPLRALQQLHMPCPPTSGGARMRLASSRHFGDTRSEYHSLCFRVSKSWEIGLPLPRLPAP